MAEFNLFDDSAIILTHNICSVLVLQFFGINKAFAHHLAHLLWEKVVFFMELVNLILIVFQRDFWSVEAWEKFIKFLVVCNLVLLIKFRKSQLNLLGILQLLINSSPKQIRIIPQNLRKAVVKVFDRLFTVFDILGGPNKEILDLGNLLSFFLSFSFLFWLGDNFFAHAVGKQFEIIDHTE